LFNISEMLQTHARLRPAHIGASDSRRSLSFAVWNSRASCLASGLLAQGLQPGERVAVLAYNRIEWLEIYVALARAGLVALPLNFRLVSDELAYILKDAGARFLFVGADFIDLAEKALAEAQGALERLDRALADPQLYAKDPARAADLTRQRRAAADALAAAEEAWLAASS
jgi:acyl-CoA synthetase (AMP-forming)/AMP-acid ligase II